MNTIINGYRIKGTKRLLQEINLKWQTEFSVYLDNLNSTCDSNKKEGTHHLIIAKYFLSNSQERLFELTKLLSRAYPAENLNPLFACSKFRLAPKQKINFETESVFLLFLVTNSIIEIWANDFRNLFWPDLVRQEIESFANSISKKIIMGRFNPLKAEFLAFSLAAICKRLRMRNPLPINYSKPDLNPARKKQIAEIYQKIPRLRLNKKNLENNARFFLNTTEKIIELLKIPIKGVQIFKDEDSWYWEIY